MRSIHVQVSDTLARQLTALAVEEATTPAKLASRVLKDAIAAAKRKKLLKQWDVQTIRAYKEQPVTDKERWPQSEQAWPEWEAGAWNEAKSAGSCSSRRTKGGPSSSSRAKS